MRDRKKDTTPPVDSENIIAQIEKGKEQEFLNQHEVQNVLPNKWNLYHFGSGEEFALIKDHIVPQLIPMWASALSRSEDDQLVIEDSAKYPFIKDYAVDLVMSEAGEVAAIYLHTPLMYEGIAGVSVHICLVHEKFQGNGLMRKLIETSITPETKFLKLQTQNEHMVQTIRKFSPEGYLFPIDGTPEEQVRQMAQSYVKETQKPTYDADLMISRGMYASGSPLYGDRRERIGNHTDIHTFFSNNVDFQNGDSVLVIGFLPDN